MPWLPLFPPLSGDSPCLPSPPPPNISVRLMTPAPEISSPCSQDMPVLMGLPDGVVELLDWVLFNLSEILMAMGCEILTWIRYIWTWFMYRPVQSCFTSVWPPITLMFVPVHKSSKKITLSASTTTSTTGRTVAQFVAGVHSAIMTGRYGSPCALLQRWAPIPEEWVEEHRGELKLNWCGMNEGGGGVWWPREEGWVLRYGS